MKTLSKFALLALSFCLLLQGCATIISGTTQTISVQAINEQNHQIIPGALCTITDGKGRVYPINSNPGNVLVSKGQGALSVNCHKQGYKQTQIGIGESFNGWTVANIIFWPGAIVDAATGAIQKYPSHITVLMLPVRK